MSVHCDVCACVDVMYGDGGWEWDVRVDACWGWEEWVVCVNMKQLMKVYFQVFLHYMG